MPLTDKEQTVLKRAISARRAWRFLRFALIPVALAAVIGAFYILGLPELTRNPLTAYLAGLLLLMGVGLTAFLISGWSDARNETLIELLQRRLDH